MFLLISKDLQPRFPSFLQEIAFNCESQARPAAKALNKPLLIAGVDMRLAGLALVIATVVGAVNDAVVYKGIAAALFLGICAGARIATRRDPNMLLVWNLARRHRWVYDPAKRARFQVVFVRTNETE